MAHERSLTDPLIAGPAEPGTAASSFELVSSNSFSQDRPHSLPVSHEGGRSTGTQVKKEKKKKKERVTWAGDTGELIKPKSRRVKMVHAAINSEDREGEEDILEDEEYPSHYSMYTQWENSVSPKRSSRSQDGSFRSQDNFTRSPADSMLSAISEEGGVIDGRYTVSPSEVQGYVRVEIPNGEDPSSLTRNLELCKRTVLRPYLIFLKLIGWRWIHFIQQDVNESKCSKVANIVWPSFIFIMLIYASCVQTVTCFLRDSNANIRIIGSGENATFLIRCDNHLVTRLLLQDVLLLIGYLYGLYIFRFKEPENLSALMERSFLSYSSMHKNAQKRLIFALRFFLFGGFLWIFFSFCINIMRIFSLRLLDSDTVIQWVTQQDVNAPEAIVHTSKELVARYVLVISSVIGFIFFDFFYLAVVINYASQGQLLYFYTGSIMDKVVNKVYGLGDAVKDMRYVYEFLQVLNGKLSILMSLCLFIFVQATISSVYGLYEIDPEEFAATDSGNESYALYLSVAVGICSVILWTVLTLLPIAQAAKLTSAFRKLRRTGLEISSRPRLYAGTPQLVLDSFLNYTNATRYTAKLAQVPIYPWCVVGFWFAFGTVLVIVLGTYVNLRIAFWF